MMKPGGGIGNGGSLRVIPLPPRAFFRGGKSRICTRDFFAAAFFLLIEIFVGGICITFPSAQPAIARGCLQITKARSPRFNLYFLERGIAVA